MRTMLSLIALATMLGAQLHAQNAPIKTTDRPAAKPSALVNLNTATSPELQQLPGIGAKVAARIVEYRQKKGPFKKIEELMNVQGIGEKTFLRLRVQITVGVKPEPAAPQHN